MAKATDNALADKPGREWPKEPLDLIDAQRLVGCFLWNWAALESQINTSIRQILRIDTLTMSMLSVHLSVYAKIHILRCAADLFDGADAEWAAGAKKLFNQITALSEQRNIIAHCVFFETDDKKAVKFHRVKATGTLSMPETNWTPDDFGSAVMTMGSLMAELRKRTEEIVERRSGVKMRGEQQRNYLQRLLALGDNLGSDSKPLTIAEVLADRGKTLAPNESGATAPEGE